MCHSLQALLENVKGYNHEDHGGWSLSLADVSCRIEPFKIRYVQSQAGLEEAL